MKSDSSYKILGTVRHLNLYPGRAYDRPAGRATLIRVISGAGKHTGGHTGQERHRRARKELYTIGTQHGLFTSDSCDATYSGRKAMAKYPSA